MIWFSVGTCVSLKIRVFTTQKLRESNPLFLGVYSPRCFKFGTTSSQMTLTTESPDSLSHHDTTNKTPRRGWVVVGSSVRTGGETGQVSQEVSEVVRKRNHQLKENPNWLP